jgi:hypothetical protein
MHVVDREAAAGCEVVYERPVIWVTLVVHHHDIYLDLRGDNLSAKGFQAMVQHLGTLVGADCNSEATRAVCCDTLAMLRSVSRKQVEELSGPRIPLDGTFC